MSKEAAFCFYTSCNRCGRGSVALAPPLGSFDASHLIIVNSTVALPNRSKAKFGRMLKLLKRLSIEVGDVLFFAVPCCVSGVFSIQCLFWVELLVKEMPNLKYVHFDGKDVCGRLGISPKRFYTSFRFDGSLFGRQLTFFLRASYLHR